jgi:hypothetical protein
MLHAAFLSEAVYRFSELHQQPGALHDSIQRIAAAYRASTGVQLQVHSIEAPAAAAAAAHRSALQHSLPCPPTPPSPCGTRR